MVIKQAPRTRSEGPDTQNPLLGYYVNPEHRSDLFQTSLKQCPVFAENRIPNNIGIPQLRTVLMSAEETRHDGG